MIPQATHVARLTTPVTWGGMYVRSDCELAGPCTLLHPAPALALKKLVAAMLIGEPLDYASKHTTDKCEGISVSAEIVS